MLLAISFGVPSLETVASETTTTTAVSSAAGSFWEQLWLRNDQRAHKALTEGQPERAAILFDDPQWRAVARYRSGDWADALRGFNKDQSDVGTYNRANTLARLGEYQDAIDLYATVLQQQPDHEDAAFNKALIERLLQQQQQQQSDEQDNESESQQQQQDSESQQSQNNDEQQQSDQQADESQSDPSDQQSESEQDLEGDDQNEQRQEMVNRDEKQEALEQWLRRVPDEPGGLLRRKFQHETKQRLRNGEYENRQGEKVW